jgi:hypothetical protein
VRTPSASRALMLSLIDENRRKMAAMTHMIRGRFEPEAKKS